MAAATTKTKKVIVNSIDKDQQVFVGLNGYGYQIKCNEEVELPEDVIAILKNSVETRYVADRDSEGRVKGTKEVQEKRYIVEAV